MPLEIERRLFAGDTTRLFDQDAADFVRIRGPGIDHDAVTVNAVFKCQRTAAIGPSQRVLFASQRPAHEALHLVRFVDDETIVLAIDLSDQDARPVAEAKLGEGVLRHQMADGQAERDCRMLRSKDAQCPLCGRFALRHESIPCCSRRTARPLPPLVGGNDWPVQ